MNLKHFRLSDTTPSIFQTRSSLRKTYLENVEIPFVTVFFLFRLKILLTLL